MLTDIFADRYEDRSIWEGWSPTESKLLVQCYQLVSQDVLPFHVEGKECDKMRAKWKSIHDRLCRELGRESLSPLAYSYNTVVMGKTTNVSGMWSLDQVCKTFVTADFLGASPDRFVKERLSFVELAFRLRGEEISATNSELPATIRKAVLAHLEWQDRMKSVGRSIGGHLAKSTQEVEAGVRAANAGLNEVFASQVAELNARFRQASVPLNYHNGYIQISKDERIQEQVEKPFWNLVADPIWKNVSIDMAEAVDRRESADRDPALYAAKALESAIKIISDQRGWTHGGENGAHNYIDNLGSAKNGHFISNWERESLKAFFTAVRNPLGHGPGGEPMPELSPTQTDWAIEACMSWVKALIGRL
jgi:hypothetical protein